LWSDESVAGSFKFLRGLWKTVYDHAQAGIAPRYAKGELSKELKELRLKLHRAIEKVGDDYGRRLQFNTAIAAIRELLNLYDDLRDASPVARAVRQEVLEDVVLMLAPVVPHITTALWEALRPGTRLLDQPWPAVDAAALVQDEIELVVQVNGKLRGHILVPTSATREQIELFALANESVKKFVNGQKPKKVVVVPGKLVNVVV
jgi:leucyl-tRNA synthetase